MPTRNESSLVADDEKVAEVVVAVDEKVSVADDEKVVAAADELALVAAWRELADRHARITWALERSLHEQHRLGVSEFEVLERLADEGDTLEVVGKLRKIVNKPRRLEPPNLSDTGSYVIEIEPQIEPRVDTNT